jgi:hypothetical protein
MTDDARTEQPGAPAALSPTFLAYAPALALGVIFVAMLSLSWGKWPDVLVDFGHELYIPWQLAAGKVLGRDVLMGATGSLSPYLNALAFAAIGVSLRSLVALNLALLAVLTWLLFVLLREAADRLSATVACAFFLTVFAFGQYVGIGNYNYVTPYSHGATHGMLLSLVAIAFSWRHSRTNATRDLALASAAVGLVLLTKPEIFVACAAALGSVAALRLRDAPDWRTRRAWGFALTLPAFAPPLLSLGLLSLRAGPAVAWRATFAPFIALGTPLARNPFYLAGLGLDDPAGNAWRAATWFAGYVVLFGSAALLDVRAGTRRGARATAVLAAAFVAAASWWIPLPVWYGVARPLPIIAALGCALSLVAAWRGPRPCPPAALLRAGLSVFAALLLLKMALNARVFHYGFVLAMPAALLLLTWLVAWIPRALRERGGTGGVFRAVALTAIAVVAGSYVSIASRHFDHKTVAVGTGGDVFLADERGAFVNAMLSGLAQEPTGTLAVIPEGVMINYLSRRENPSPYLSYLPDALGLWGEATLLERYRSRPPSLVVVVHRDATEHGASLFGRDYATATLGWLQETYDPVARAGGSPFEPATYGMMLLRHKGAPPTAAPPSR